MSQFTVVKTEMSIKGECATCGETVDDASHLWVQYSASASDEPNSLATIDWGGVKAYVTDIALVCDGCVAKRPNLIKERAS